MKDQREEEVLLKKRQARNLGGEKERGLRKEEVRASEQHDRTSTNGMKTEGKSALESTDSRAEGGVEEQQATAPWTYPKDTLHNVPHLFIFF